MELKELWFNTVPTYDAFTKYIFIMRAMLLWRVHDFIAYVILSSCNVHGYKACPVIKDIGDF